MYIKLFVLNFADTLDKSKLVKTSSVTQTLGFTICKKKFKRKKKEILVLHCDLSALFYTFQHFLFRFFLLLLTSCQVLKLLEFSWWKLIPMEGHPYFWSIYPSGWVARCWILKFVTYKSKDIAICKNGDRYLSIWLCYSTFE